MTPKASTVDFWFGVATCHLGEGQASAFCGWCGGVRAGLIDLGIRAQIQVVGYVELRGLRGVGWIRRQRVVQ